MRLTQIINNVREAVKDTNSQRYRWSDKQIAAWINSSIDSSIRHAVEADDSYQNHRLDLAASLATEVGTGVHEYRIPHWVMNVAEVFEQPTGGEGEGDFIQRMRNRTDQDGWMLERRRVLRLHRSQAVDLRLYVAKRPSRLTKGTLPTQAAENIIRLDADNAATEFPHDAEQDIYANAVFELTTAGFEGIFGYGKSSVGRNEASGSYFTDVTLEAAMTGKTDGQTYEMHAEVPDEHMRYIELLTAMRCFEQTANTESMAAINQALQYEHKRFIESLQPRQTGEPLRWSRGDEDPYFPRRSDPDSLQVWPF